MEILMYLLFLSAGFGLGIVCSISFFLRRIEGLSKQPVSVPQPQVYVNVNAELVARYLDSFNLVAIPKEFVTSAGEPLTRH